jgi:hypothetical protein
MHLELAKSHIDTDFLQKATVEMNKAVALDYTLSEGQVHAV